MDLKLKIIIGFVVLFIILMVWSGWAVPQLNNSSEKFDYVLSERGVNQIVPFYGEDLGEPFPIEEVIRQNVIREQDNVLEINLSIIGTNLATSEIIFVQSEVFHIDKFTHLYDDNSNRYFNFPSNVKKQDYLGSIPFNSIPAKTIFQKNEKISDLETYQFLCESKNNNVTNSFPQFYPHTVFINYKCIVNVEPKTGNIVYLELDWDTYFVEDGVRTLQAEIGGVKIVESSSINLIEQTKKQLQLLFIYEIIVPIILFLIGIIVLSAIILFQKVASQNQLILKSRGELIKKERLSVIGELAARISHDIRNPLSVLTLDIELLKRQKKLDEKQIKRLDNSINRISHQIELVLDNVKEKTLQFSEFNLYDLTSKIIDNMEIPSEVKINLIGDKFKMIADYYQIEIMLSNLILNSLQELENGGIIDISLSKSDVENIIEVKDSGSGITIHPIDKIFDPLVSSKEKGTGLGLVSVKTIVSKHGGTISVKNNPTRFLIKIPKRMQK